MTVYELIQELAQFEPDIPVDFHVKTEFDEDVSFDAIKSDRRGDVATIYLEY